MPLNNTALRNMSSTVKYYERADRDGLSVRVSPNGKKTFQFRYRFIGVPRRMRLGSYPDTSLKEARERLRGARELLDNGVDPIVYEKAQVSSIQTASTVKELCQKWVADYAEPRRRRWQDLENMLKKDVYRQIGAILLADVSRLMVSELALQPIVRRGSPVQANKVLTLLKQIFNYGLELGYLEINPCAVLTKRSVGGREVSRSRVLNDQEIQAVWCGLDDTDISLYIKLAIKILIVTAQRRGEITRARWEHIDFEGNTWFIPEEHSKNGSSHKVPLSPLALDLFFQLKSISVGSEWVMPSVSGEGKPMSERAISRAVNRHIEEIGVEKWVPHDLRRTAATKMNEVGVQPHVVEKILNHKMVGVMAVYNRYDYWPECAAAMDLWSNVLARLVKG